MATATSHRAWEIGGTSANSNTTPRGQLPSITALTSVLPAAPGSNGLPSPASTRERDSGAWSSQPQSTRSSAYSSSTSYQASSHTNSYYMSPNRVSNSSQFATTSHPADYTSAPISSSVVTSPGYAPAPSALPSLNQVHDPNRVSQDFPPQESRRSSLGSQVNQGLNSLQLNGNNSPYTGSVNHSTTSLAQNPLAQNLSRERGITAANGAVRNSRSSGQLPMAPLSPNSSETRLSGSTPRIAPPIGRNPRSDVYNAFEPAPGQAYAFPDPPNVQPGDLPPKRAAGSLEDGRTGMFSRRDSDHTSITSSILTQERSLPPGQHRLEDDMPGTHHHSLQQTSMTSLNGGGSPMSTEDGITPYSRTPALRVSHKMAERKRRSEMKDLFENLRSQIPSNQGSKSSKWEILTKATEYIKSLESQVANGHAADKQLRIACHDLEMTRRENVSIRDENARLMQQLQLARAAQPAHPQQQQSMYPPSHQYAPPPSSHHDPSRSLPPLTTGSAAPSSMQGVQYSHEQR